MAKYKIPTIYSCLRPLTREELLGKIKDERTKLRKDPSDYFSVVKSEDLYSLDELLHIIEQMVDKMPACEMSGGSTPSPWR